MSVQSLRFIPSEGSFPAADYPAEFTLQPEPGHYRIVGFMGCPWCRRVITARRLLGLEPVLAASVAWSASADGFVFEDSEEIAPATGPKLGFDPDLRSRTHQELYRRQSSWEPGEPTPVPVVVNDRNPHFLGEIVMNKTDQIVYDLAVAWSAYHAEGAPQLHPLDGDEEVAEQIAAFLNWLNEDLTPYWGKVKNAATQEDKDLAQRRIVEALVNLNDYLKDRDLTVDAQIRASDVALFATLIPLAAMHAEAAYQVGYESAIRQGADEEGAEVAGFDAVARAGSPFADWSEVDRYYQRLAKDPVWLTDAERKALRLA
ncbi:hypothetical protein [Boudabousia marimammalium]|uniref:GST N-terminal domain-containing protein n=1 Tax=Boudabousia marimammalium TaxID=156892 RepID=A0A1Q5PMH3_9ACTO|nr:hypothetical protein [Boudabousia marimammalium]OKL48727.1 hypothetical protein BM477_05905 [Boudabousia marimammalium]